ncbi:uncharacterized protein DFL_007907 [Arthrobotrys flagrans]|uniref:Uncharacterized protein n=1 Tax=Arthrobotrys flagrans TaxID=97331 RepID=A0A436ZX18_ARTFL|nr:hypothetical protein DFL_007907 [Arthrobotrys flagrans]
MEDYGFPDGEFPNVKTLRVHPHFLYDGAKLFKPLVKLFPNVENLAIYIAHQMFVGNRLVYVEHYDSISLFQKVKDIRTFWPEDYDYEHGSEFLSPWRLEGIVKGWAKNARVLEKVVFVRSTPKWRCGGTDTMEAIRVRVEWVGGECETKCLWSERYKAERLEFDVD